MSKENSDSTTSVNRVVLLPCPFCGTELHGVDYIGEKDRWVNCDNEKCAMNRIFPSEEEAINAWNSRVELALHNALSTIEYFVDHEIDAMEESGQWSMHAINALLYLQSAVDTKLKEIGKSGQ